MKNIKTESGIDRYIVAYEPKKRRLRAIAGTTNGQSQDEVAEYTASLLRHLGVDDLFREDGCTQDDVADYFTSREIDVQRWISDLHAAYVLGEDDQWKGGDL